MNMLINNSIRDIIRENCKIYLIKASYDIEHMRTD